MFDSIKVLIVGKKFNLPFNVVHLERMHSLMETIATFQPDVIVSSNFQPGALRQASFEIRKKWLHVPVEATDEGVAEAARNCYRSNIYRVSPLEFPLISVYTPTKNTGDFLRDTYQSLREQSYSTWEWVVVDDCSDDGTWAKLESIAHEDHRVRPFRAGVSSGKIGNLKDQATRLCRGSILVELDHDDMLTNFALAEIVEAFKDESVGMIYSNYASFFENGEPHLFTSPDFKYRDTEYGGKVWKECLTPDIYDRFGPDFTQQFGWFLTVGPHHVKGYRAELLRQFGGYNPNLTVSDDWDMFARFFLRSKCKRIDKLLYLYRIVDNWQNTSFTHNASIQEHLEIARVHRAEEFKAFNEQRNSSKIVMPARLHEEDIPVPGPDLSALNLELLTIPPEQRRVSYVVPVSVPSDLTKRCLKSIRQFSPDSEIILVSNGCNLTGDFTTLADKLVHLEMNMRFGPACNRGALEATAPVICFMNDDACFVDGDTPELLDMTASNNKIAGPFSNRAKPPQGDVPRDQCPKQCIRSDMVVGVCMMMPTALFHELDGFDPRLDTWEDDDLCKRADMRGVESVVVGGTWVEHERHASFVAQGEDVICVQNTNRDKFIAKWPKLRVIAIAKDEESCIQEFYEQFAPITRDWCLLDTGSTDRTIEIARSIGVQVKQAPFTDFASMRNKALDDFELRETGGWTIMLDPDERLDVDTIRAIPDLIATAQHDVYLSPLHSLNLDGSKTEWVGKAFLFRSDNPEIRYEFKVHEKLIGSLNQAWVVNADNTHMLKYHEMKRRTGAEDLYARLSSTEPYFTDPSYRDSIRKRWPILDYDRRADPRNKNIHVGPLVTVVVPTYKRHDLLRRALESIVRQDYANLEIVVISDGDADFRLCSSRRCRCFNLPRNHGAGGAVPRNYGIMLAAGEYIAYLDDDNAWLPEHVSDLMNAIRTTGATWACSSMLVNGIDLEFQGPPQQGMIDTSCVIHHKSLIRKYGWWKDRTQGTYAHDWELFNRWLVNDERWACSHKATVDYNAETCGQWDFLRQMAEKKRKSADPIGNEYEMLYSHHGAD
jgi:glycosyltransferase involved in cell wall biosynthesis